MARLPALRSDDLAPEQQAVFDKIAAGRGFVPRLYGVMANAPDGMAAFIEFTDILRADSPLPTAHKELTILLVGKLTEAQTIVSAHTSFAKAAGVSGDQIEELSAWRRSDRFSAEERAMFAYIEAVTRNIRVGNEIWQAVRSHFSDAELTDLTLVIGCYNMVARFLEPLEIEVDPRYRSQHQGLSSRG